MTTAVKTIGTHKSNADVIEVGWSPLYTIGGVAALMVVLFIPVAIYVFIAWPPPTTVVDWYALFQSNRLVALIDMDILIVLSNIVSIPLTLALYVALRRTNESYMAIALVLELVGAATYFASNPVLTMISLSNQYAVAATDVQRSMLLAAGQGMLATYQGTAFWVSNAVGGISLLIISVVMLRSGIFSKITAYIGIVANVVGFGLFIPNQIGIFISILGVVGLAIWYVMVALRLFQLSRVS